MHELHSSNSDNSKAINLEILGSSGFAPAVKNANRHYPVLEQILRPVGANIEWQNLVRRYGLQYNQIQTRQEMPLLVDNMFHTIRGRGDTFTVTFKDNPY